MLTSDLSFLKNIVPSIFHDGSRTCEGILCYLFRILQLTLFHLDNAHTSSVNPVWADQEEDDV